MTATLDELSYKENIDFNFQHSLFKIEGCVFRRSADGKEVSLYVPMGDIVAAVPVHQIRLSFEIAPGSQDEKLMQYAAQALQYVRRVYPGDSIPTDVISGRAPWMVEEQYLTLARARVALQIVSWKTGEDLADLEPEDAVARVEDKETQNLVKQAYEELAQKLELGEGGVKQVMEQVEKLGQELAYVEALHEKLQPVRRIQAGLKTLFSAYRDEKAMRESITRCNSLLDTPIKEIFAKFVSFDANTGEILNTLKRFDAQIDYIRLTRDELRQVYLKWEDLLAHWEKFKGVRDDHTEHLVRETYHFAAQHFVQTVEW